MKHLFSALAAVPLLFSAAQAQQVIQIRADSCEECRIQSRHTVTLGNTADEFGIGLFGTTVARPTSGHYWVASAVSPGEIAVYSEHGQLLRTIGRRGQGPNEFGVITRIRGLNDGQIAVVDQGNARIAIVTEEGRALNHLHIGGQLHDIHRVGDRYFVQAGVPGAGRLNHPVHRLAADGSIERSFGAPDEPPSQYLALAPRATALDPVTGHLYIADRNQYRIIVTNAAGEVVRILERRVGWFTPWTEPRRGEPFANPPSPVIASIEFDENGLLWTMANIPSSGWRTVPQEQRADTSLDQLYDTMIEVIDVRAGTVLATARSPRLMWRYLAPRAGYALRQAETGDVVVDVWLFNLARGRQR
jgi:hypothetical protein